MSKAPKKVFIVPYRNRPEQKFFFCKYMQFLLEHTQDYEVYFSHQCDERSFNRGATRNIGFLVMKDKYPDDYQDMTFIFNDLDTIPFNRIFDYDTEHGVVKHYYGFKHSLGGIVVMKGSDFEAINGYPNFWAWGLEDTCLQKRCENNGLRIDRTDFYKIGAPEILQLFDGVDRIINKKDPHRLRTEDGSVGLSTLQDVEFTIDKKSAAELDNVFSSLSKDFFYINITRFSTETSFEDDEYYRYDLREPVKNITNPLEVKRTTHVNTSPTEWSNISYYPTNEERKEMANMVRSHPPHPPHSQNPLQQQMRRNVHVVQPNVAMPSPPNATHVAGTRHVVVPSQSVSASGPPTTFKQMKAQNTHMFPPKSMHNAGGASALNKINLRYRMTSI